MVLNVPDQKVAYRTSGHRVSYDVTPQLALSVRQMFKQLLRRGANSSEFRNQALKCPLRYLDVSGIQFFVHSVVGRSAIASGGNQPPIGEDSFSIDHVHQHFFDCPFAFGVFVVKFRGRHLFKGIDCLDQVPA